jgi:hypothetical protein
MADHILHRIPVVGGLGYVERVRSTRSPFTATLSPERDNRYFLHAIAVLVDGGKVGYVAPEVAREYFEPLAAAEGPHRTCPGRRATVADHESSGVELLLDFSNLAVPAPK